MSTVLPFKPALASPSYWRPRIGWIKRRARRIERFYGVTRRLAVYDAWLDYQDFTRLRDAQVLPMERAVQRGNTDNGEVPHG